MNCILKESAGQSIQSLDFVGIIIILLLLIIIIIIIINIYIYIYINNNNNDDNNDINTNDINWLQYFESDSFRGDSPFISKNMLESNALKSRFSVCGLAVDKIRQTMCNVKCTIENWNRNNITIT